MENATKALLIAAGVLIGIMIISLGVALYSEMDIYVQATHEKIKANEQNSFNRQFAQYNSTNLTIQDVVTVANLAYENNASYNATEAERQDQSSLYVAVYLNGTPIEQNINERATELLTDALANGSTYKCAVFNYSEMTGRVYEIRFLEE